MLPDKDGPAVGGGQTSDKEDPSVSLFREYLRLRTVHPEPDYGETHSYRYTRLQVFVCSFGGGGVNLVMLANPVLHIHSTLVYTHNDALLLRHSHTVLIQVTR